MSLVSPATALIAEDEPLLAQHLRAELASLWPALQVVAQVADGQSALAQALALQPDICFLDIRMPGQSGLEVAQALAEDWPDSADARSATPSAAARPFPLLVFVTAYEQYALQAFDAQAVDYLVKPVQTERLQACLARLHERLQARLAARSGDALEPALAQLRALLQSSAGTVAGNANPSRPPARLEVIQASVGNLVHLVPVAEVLYFEAADKYARVITAHAEHLIRISLRELLPQLDTQVFWQVHRGLVVRAAAISTAQRDESGKVFLSLRGRSERLTASRLYAHLFKGM